MRDKVTATIVECTWNWGAIVEMYDVVLVGGIPACGGGWHEHPRKGYVKTREDVIYAGTKAELIKKLNYRYSKYELIIVE